VVLLLTAAGSDSVAVTLAVVVAVPAEVGITTVVSVVLSPDTSLVTMHVTTRFDDTQLPWVIVLETTFTPDGNVCVRNTSDASSGPELLTCTA
jgi:hypothetical protein